MDCTQALEHVSDGVLGLDREWRIAYVNPRAELLFRKRRDELMGRVWWELFPYMEETPAATELRATAAGGMARRFQLFHPPLYAWHEIRAAPVDGGVALVIRDVTDVTRLQQTEAVRAAVREVFDPAPIAISVLRGPEHRVEIMNPMARQVLGGRDLEGRSVRAALPELEGQGLFELLDQVYETGEAYEGTEVPVHFDRRGDGEMSEGIFNISYRPLFDANGEVSGVLSISVEVTDLVRRREELPGGATE